MQESVKPKLGFRILKTKITNMNNDILLKIIDELSNALTWCAKGFRRVEDINGYANEQISGIEKHLKNIEKLKAELLLKEETAKDLPDEKEVCINHKMITAPGLGEYCEICGYGLDDL